MAIASQCHVCLPTSAHPDTALRLSPIIEARHLSNLTEKRQQSRLRNAQAPLLKKQCDGFGAGHVAGSW